MQGRDGSWARNAQRGSIWRAPVRWYRSQSGLCQFQAQSVRHGVFGRQGSVVRKPTVAMQVMAVTGSSRATKPTAE